MRMQHFSLNTQPGTEGVEVTEVEHSTDEATDEEAMSLLKDWRASENSVEGTNYLAIRAETVSSTQEAVNVLTQTSVILIANWVGVNKPNINFFGINNGYGIGRTIGGYKIELLYANPSGGVKAGTIFSVKQLKRGGTNIRLDYGKLHNGTGKVGLHTTIRFKNPFTGKNVGSSAQRTWYPPFKRIKKAQE